MPDEASERLFTASAVIDTEPEIKPIIIFEMKSIRLQTIPTNPDNFPYEALTEGLPVSF